MRRTFFLLILSIATTLAFAQTYKWRDANGRIQYTDTPPPAGAKDVQQLSRPSSAPSAAGTKSVAEQDAEFRKRLASKQEAEAKQAKSDADAQLRQKNCESARAWLASLEAGGRIALLNEKGERYALEDAQREQQKTEAKKAVDSWCK